MMVVADEVFVEFVSGMVVAAGNFVNDADRFKVSQVSIGRTLRQTCAILQQFRHAGGAAVLEQQFH